ncbi:SRPBCC family protein [Streptomyces sp. R11]|uniref:SRPBCC family protein n=1 Tax=Streptomyces sp. R11 TaxID=3238625 RepID=A0AB39MVI8_9ACTN
MTIDVSAERVIPFPPEQVAAYAMDWRHDRDWTQGIRRAELTREADEGGFGVGAEVKRTAHFLGRHIGYVLRVASYDFPRLLDMVAVAGPVPMQITYAFDPHADGTLARIRVRGGPGGVYRPAAPIMARHVRHNIGKDLRDLERRLTERTG